MADLLITGCPGCGLTREAAADATRESFSDPRCGCPDQYAKCPVHGPPRLGWPDPKCLTCSDDGMDVLPAPAPFTTIDDLASFVHSPRHVGTVPIGGHVLIKVDGHLREVRAMAVIATFGGRAMVLVAAPIGPGEGLVPPA